MSDAALRLTPAETREMRDEIGSGRRGRPDQHLIRT